MRLAFLSRLIANRSRLSRGRGKTARGYRLTLEELEQRLAPAGTSSADFLPSLLRSTDVQALAGGLDQALARVQSALQSGVSELDLPIVGTQVRDGMKPLLDRIDAARADLHVEFDKLEQAVGATSDSNLAELFQHSIYTIFGPAGANILEDGPDHGGDVGPSDVVLATGSDHDAQGNAIPGTGWLEWDMHLGQRYYRDLPFSAGADLARVMPGLGFHIDASNGVRFDLRWDLRFGLGISQLAAQRYYLNSGAKDGAGNEVPELTVGVDVSAAPPKDALGHDLFSDQPGLSADASLGLVQSHVSDGTETLRTLTAPVGLPVSAFSLTDYSGRFTLVIADRARGTHSFDIDYHSPAGGETAASFAINLSARLAQATGSVYSDLPLPAVDATLDASGINGFFDPTLPTTPSLKINARTPDITALTIRDAGPWGFSMGGPNGNEQYDDQNAISLGFGVNQVSTAVGNDQVLTAAQYAPAEDVLMKDTKFFVVVGGQRVARDGGEVTVGGTRFQVAFPSQEFYLQTLAGTTTLLDTLRDEVRNGLDQAGLDPDLIDVEMVDGRFQLIAHGSAGSPAPLVTVYGDPLDRTHLKAGFSVDIKGPSYNRAFLDPNNQLTFNRLTIGPNSELKSGRLLDLFVPQAQASAALRLQVDGDLNALTGAAEQALGLAGGSLGLPGLSFGFKLDAHARVDFSKPAGQRTESKIDKVEFDDVQLDVGSLLESVAVPIANTVGKALGPFLDVVGGGLDNARGWLNEPIPFISDLGLGDISLLDLSGNKATLNAFLDTVSGLSTFVTGVNNFLAHYDGRPIAFGCFDLDLDTGDLVPCEIQDSIDSFKAISLDNFMTSAKESFLKPGGIQLDILKPRSIMNMLQGKPFDIVSLNLPEVDLFLGRKLGFHFDDLSFNIDVGAHVHLGSSTAPLGIVYDSTGLGHIVDAFRSGADPDWSDLLDGFYVRLDPRDASPDAQPGNELFVDFGLHGKGEAGPVEKFGVTWFHLEAKVDVDATLAVDLKDPNGDGKLRLDEIYDLTDGFTDPAKLLCLIDASAGISGGFDFDGTIAGASVSSDDLGIPTHFNASLKLSDVFKNFIDCDHGSPKPILATPIVVDGQQVLRLNVGPFASARIYGDTDDSDGARISARTDGNGDILVSGYGVTDQRYHGSFARVLAVGGAGNDTIDLSGVSNIGAEIRGNDGDDVLSGTQASDLIVGGAGNNTVSDGGGDDVIDLSDNSVGVVYTTGGGNDTVYGSAFNDTLMAGGGSTVHLEGQGGDDVLKGGSGADFLDGGDGNDSLYGGDGNDSLYGGDGDDLLSDVLVDDQGRPITSVSTSRGSTLHGGRGNDVLISTLGTNDLFGDDGDDVLHGGSGADRMSGGLGDDTLFSGSPGNVMSGDAGDDTFVVNRGGVAHGGSGHDTVSYNDLDSPTDLSSLALGARQLTVAVAGGPAYTATFDTIEAVDVQAAGEVSTAYVHDTPAPTSLRAAGPLGHIGTVYVAAISHDTTVVASQGPRRGSGIVVGQAGDTLADRNSLDAIRARLTVGTFGRTGNYLHLHAEGTAARPAGDLVGQMADLITGLGMPGAIVPLGLSGIDVYLGDGNDVLTARGYDPGSTRVFAGAGNDDVTVALGNVEVFGGPGKDRVGLAVDPDVPHATTHDVEGVFIDNTASTRDGKWSMAGGEISYFGLPVVTADASANLEARLGSGNDQVTLTAVNIPVLLKTGPGADTVTFTNAFHQARGLTGKITLLGGDDADVLAFDDSNNSFGSRFQVNAPAVPGGLATVTGDVLASPGASIAFDVEKLNFLLGPADDTLDVPQTVSELSVTSAGGTDRVTIGKLRHVADLHFAAGTALVSVTDVAADLAVEGPGGQSLLSVGNSADVFNRTVELSASQVTGLGPGPGTVTYSGVNLDLKLGSGGDRVNVSGTADATTTIETGRGDDLVTFTAAQGTVVVIGGDGDDTVDFQVAGDPAALPAYPFGNVQFSGVETVRVESLGFSGSTDWLVQDNVLLAGSTPIVNVGSVEHLDLRAGAGSDELTVAPTSNDGQRVGIFNGRVDISTPPRLEGYQGFLPLDQITFPAVIDGLDGVSATAVSPDGKYVYVAGKLDNALLVFKRQGGTADPEKLLLLQPLKQGIDGADGLTAPTSLALSPDGQFVYVTGTGTLAVFQRQATGKLSEVAVLHNGQGGISGMASPKQATVSPDGRAVFVAGDNGLVVFARDPATGLPSYVQTLNDGDGVSDGLSAPRNVTVSTDGRNVYVIAGEVNDRRFDRLAVFHRSPGGRLVFQQSFGWADYADVGLRDLKAIAVSGDGKFVFVLGQPETSNDGALLVFRRDLATGTLTYQQTIWGQPHPDHRDGGIGSINGPRAIAASPDGKHVYVTAAGFDQSGGGSPPPGGLTVFAVDAATGNLSYVTSYDRWTGASLNPGAVAVSPDGSRVAVRSTTFSGVEQVLLYQRDAGMGELTSTQKFSNGTDGVTGITGGVSFRANGDLFTGDAVFTRDPDTGDYVFAPGVQTNGMTISADGRHAFRLVSGFYPVVFIGSPREYTGRLEVYDRDPDTGAIASTPRQVIQSHLDYDALGYSSIRTDVGGLRRPVALTLGPDGNLYVLGGQEGALLTFKQDAATGTVELLQKLRDGDGIGNGQVQLLGGPQMVTVSPDGRAVFLGNEWAVAEFERDPASGELAFIQFFSANGFDLYHQTSAQVYSDYYHGDFTNPANFPALTDIATILAGPSDRRLYAAAGGQVTLIERDAVTGFLHTLQTVGDGAAEAAGPPAGLALNADGSLLYAAFAGGNRLDVFRRASDDTLTFDQRLDPSGPNGVSSLDTPDAVAVNPTSGAVYVAGLRADALTVLLRHPGPKLDDVHQVIREGQPADGVLSSLTSLVVGSSTRAYAVSPDDHAIVVLAQDRGGVTGAAQLLQATLSNIPDLNGVTRLLIDPFSSPSYAVALNPSRGALLLFSVDADGLLHYTGSYRDAGLVGVNDGALLSYTGTGQDYLALTNPGQNALLFFKLTVSAVGQGATALAPVATYRDGVGGVDGLAGATAIAVAGSNSTAFPYDYYVYVAGRADNAVAVFGHKFDSGDPLTFLNAYRDGLSRPTALAVSYQHLYVVSQDSNSLTLFQRDPGLGTLALDQVLRQGGGVKGLSRPVAVLSYGFQTTDGNGQLVEVPGALVLGAGEQAITLFNGIGTSRLAFAGQLREGDFDPATAQFVHGLADGNSLTAYFNVLTGSGPGADVPAGIGNFGFLFSKGGNHRNITFSDVEGLTVSTRDGADTYQVFDTTPGVPTTLSTGGGDDLVRVLATADDARLAINTQDGDDETEVFNAGAGAQVPVDGGPGFDCLHVHADFTPKGPPPPATDDSTTYTLTLTTGAGTIPYTSIECPPTIVFTNAGGPYRITEGDGLALDASKTLNGQNWTWDLNDDGIFGDAVGVNPTLTWQALAALGIDDDGIYPVAVQATDSDNRTDTAYTTLTILNKPPALRLAGNPTVAEASPYALRLTGGSDPGNDTIRFWTIDWDDGTTQDVAGNPTSVMHVYADGPARHTIRATASDEDGTYSAGSLTVDVLNVPPDIVLNGPATVQSGKEYLLGFTAHDVGLDTVRSWTIAWGDGTSDTLPGTATEMTHVYTTSGSKAISVTASDEDGSYTASRGVLVQSAAPAIQVDAPGPLAEGASFSLNVATGQLGSDTAHHWRIDWGDGSSSDMGTISPAAAGTFKMGAFTAGHVYADNALYAVTIRVSDDLGGHDTRTLLVAVGNVAPTLVVPGPQSVVEGQAFFLPDLADVSDPGFRNAALGTDETFTFSVDWGDGSTPEQGTVPVTAIGTSGVPTRGAVGGGHTYADDGTYTVVVTVRDDDGGTATQSFQVLVSNVAPTLTVVGEQSADEGQLLSLPELGTFSDPGFGPTERFAFTIDWGDGSPVESGPATVATPGAAGAATRGSFAAGHVYADNGAYTVRVTLTDDDGGSAGEQTFRVQVGNSNPTLALPGEQTVPEGSRLQLPVLGSIRDAGYRNPALGTDEAFTYSISWGDGSPVERGTASLRTAGRAGLPTAADFAGSHVYADNGDYTVTVTTTDDDGGSTTGTFVVHVVNIAPAVAPVTDLTVGEGEVFTLDDLVRFSDPGFRDAVLGSDETFTYRVNWGDGSPVASGAAQVGTVGSVGTSTQGFLALRHAYADNNSPDPDYRDSYTVAVTVTDDDGGSTHAYFRVHVVNVAPAFAVVANTSPDCGDVAEGQAMHVQVQFTDPGFDNPLDPTILGGPTRETFTYTINWDDGTTSTGTALVDVQGGIGVLTAGSLDVSHVYANGGIYTIAVTLSDDDGGTVATTTTALITGVGVNHGVLYVIGTDHADHVTINQANGEFKVHNDFLSAPYKTISATGVERIHVLLCDGDDQATVAGNITLPVFMDGGAGNDQLNGGAGPNILVGGEGADTLIGGSGSDILIGGKGADRLVGNGGDDILVGGTTDFDASPWALLRIMDEWNQPTVDYLTRVRHLRGTLDGGKNEGLCLTASTVHDDGTADRLTGSAGQDWFFALLSGGKDEITDQGKGELVG